jgi:uncharacterized protein (DUF305 family)
MTFRTAVVLAATAFAICVAIFLLPKVQASAGTGTDVDTRLAHHCGEHPGHLRDAAFLGTIRTGMTRMMARMNTPPTGSVDADFVTAMVPHHQGAIEMAEAELLYGKSVRLRRIAQEIIVDQQQEIAAMHYALGWSGR